MAAAVAAAVLLLAAGCAGFPDGKQKMVTVGGDRVTEASVRQSLSWLCQARKVAPTDPTTARAYFYDHSHTLLHSVARGLEPVDRGLAADLLVSMQKVEADLETRPPSLADDLGQLADVYHTGLARLAIKATPCVE